MLNRPELASFLRHRREALAPEDVGLPRGPRRRTPGLRREEAAMVCSMSAIYYSRLEQQRGPQPSESMLAAIARGLRLTPDERDHLFRLAGHTPPDRTVRSAHVSPGLLRTLDRLDTPAMIVNDLGETLAQNALAAAIYGDHRALEGIDRSLVYRWFADPSVRSIYPPAHHAHHQRMFVASLRGALGRDADGRAAALVARLTAESPEFVAEWEKHEVVVHRDEAKTFVVPTVGEIALHCETLTAANQTQRLIVMTAEPGSQSAQRLELLAVVGASFTAGGGAGLASAKTPD